MPEGHTIHRLARDLARDLKGEIVSASVVQDRFRAGAERIDGTVMTGTEAYGKHLFLHFAEVGTVHIHLGLFGKFRRTKAPFREPSDALRVRLATDEIAWDLTGAITCDLRDPGVVDEIASSLGPDPIRRSPDVDRFVEKVHRSSRPIGALLMDQKVVAGVGNVYRAELLLLEGLDPHTPGRDVPEETLRSLFDRITEALRLGVKRNRIITAPVDGRPLRSISRRDATLVYKKEHCRLCDTEVVWSEMDGRNLYHCPSCQT